MRDDTSGDAPLLTEPNMSYGIIKIEPEDDAATCREDVIDLGCRQTASSSPSPAMSACSVATESADENENEDEVAIDTSPMPTASTFDGIGATNLTVTGDMTSDRGSAGNKNRTGEKSECRVCGDEASGMYFGALVCVPCKTFFLRYAGEGKKFTCRYCRSCDVTVATRTQCKSCRYQKCIRVGMRRRVRPIQVQIGEGQQLCAVCSDVGNGIHFGVITCEGCKKFFRRGLVENGSYRCKNGGQCAINPQTRNLCRYCRFWKCISVGMSRNAIQMGRPTKIVSSSDGSQGATRQPRPAPALKPINYDQSARSSPAIDKLGAEVANHIWTQSNKMGGTISPPDARPVVSTPMPMFSVPPVHHPAWLQSGGLLLAIQHGLLLANAAGQSLVRPSMPLPYPVGYVLNEARNQSVSPDSTVKEDEVKHSWRQQQQAQNPADKDGPCVGVAAGELPNNSRKRTSSRSSDYGGSRTLVDSPVVPVPKYRVVDGDMYDTKSVRSQLEMNVGLDLRRCSGSVLETPGSPENNDSAGTDLTVKTRSTNEENLSVSSCVGRIGKVYRKMIEGSVSGMGTGAHLKDEVKKENSTREGQLVWSDVLSLDQMSLTSLSYWLRPRREVGEHLAVGQQHWDVVNGIIPAYDRFVHQGDCLNRMLKNDFEEWSHSNSNGHLSSWIKSKVIPAYTVASVNYCKSLPGFQHFDADDQVTIIRLGQSSSRILLAAIHWFDADDKIFRNFLSWRSAKPSEHSDKFKKMLVEYADKISALEPDPIEAALLNVLLIFATDYPNLKRVGVIEEARTKIIATLHAYTSAKFGTPSNRVGQLCSMAPEARRLGLLHYQMTKTKTMTAEEVGQTAIE